MRNERRIWLKNGLRMAVLAALFCIFCTVPLIHGQTPPPGVSMGSTPEAALHNAVVATKEQGRILGRTADAWGRRAGDSKYRTDQFHKDFGVTVQQLETLRARFRWMGYLALQLNRPDAGNLLAELDAELSLVAELLGFLDQQSNASTLDLSTLVRSCRTFEQGLHVWEEDLDKANARMGNR